MALTLLEYVQKISNKLQADEVDSIFDTEEATLYASEVLDVFKSIHSRTNDKWTKDRFVLVEKSKYELEVPENVQYVDDIKYKGVRMEYKEPDDFEYLLSQRTKDGIKYNSEGYGLKEDPKYFTTYNDTVLIFDSIIENETEDAVLLSSDTSCYGKILPSVTLEDTFVPKPLPPALESALLEEATAICLNRYREVSGTYDLRSSQRIINRMNGKSNGFKSGSYLDDFDGLGYR